MMKITPGDNQLEIAAPAKVNLFLELLGRRDDGFHELETVMSSVALYDHLRFSLRDDSDIKLSISYPKSPFWLREQDDIPTDKRNLICKSIELVRNVAAEAGESETCQRGMNIHLMKNIPSAAGLGGASSNSAAALLAANLIWGLNWSKQKLETIAGRLGSDIGFFLSCGTAICRGRGEKVEPISVPSGIAVVIAKPTESLATAKVFSKVQLDNPGKTLAKSSRLVQSIQAGNLAELGKHLFNRLQVFASQLTDQIAELEREFSRMGCLGHQMTGSGSCYYGIFRSLKTAQLAANCLSSRMPHARIFCTHTTSVTPLHFSAERRSSFWKSQK